MSPEEERSTRDNERQRILSALISFIEDGGGSFRKWLDYLGMDYHSAYDEGWMDFTNALSNHEDWLTKAILTHDPNDPTLATPTEVKPHS